MEFRVCLVPGSHGHRGPVPGGSDLTGLPRTGRTGDSGTPGLHGSQGAKERTPIYPQYRGRAQDQGRAGPPVPVPVPGRGPAPYVVSMETVGGCQESGGTAAMLRRHRWRKDLQAPLFRATPPGDGGGAEEGKANQ